MYGNWHNEEQFAEMFHYLTRWQRWLSYWSGHHCSSWGRRLPSAGACPQSSCTVDGHPPSSPEIRLQGDRLWPSLCRCTGQRLGGGYRKTYTRGQFHSLHSPVERFGNEISMLNDYFMKVTSTFVHGSLTCTTLCISVSFVEGLGTTACIVTVLFGLKLVFDV